MSDARHVDDLEARVIGLLDAGETVAALALVDERPAAAAAGMARLAAGDPGGALRSLRTALATGDERPVTRLNLALAEIAAGTAARAEHLLRALEADVPEWAEPSARLGALLHDQGDGVAAAAACARALRRDPGHAEALRTLAAIDLPPAETPWALDVLRSCCAARPGAWQAWDALGTALGRTGAIHAAHAARRRAFAAGRGVLPLALRLAGSAVAAGQVEATLAEVDAIAAAAPLNAVAHAARAALLGALHRHDAAADALDAAVTLDPAEPALALLLAEALARAGRDAAILPALDRALAAAPDHPTLRLNRGVALQRQHRHAEARDVFQALAQEAGDPPEVLCNLAGTLASCGEQDAAVATARQAVTRDPSMHLGWRMLANAMAYQDGVRAADMLAALREAGRHARRGTVPAFDRRPTPGEADKRLRLGLLSRDLRTHPVGWLALAGVETLDPAAFEVVCLGQPPSSDPMQRRFQQAASGWHVIEADPGAAAMIRALALDIVIDLGGYGDRGLLPLCAERLAPVQVKWVGMQNHSTGLAEMDWFITDRWETPAALAATYSERLLTMPDGYACYTPPPHAPEVAAAPCLRTGSVTFGCFNNYAKVTPALAATWCDILAAVPDSRLVLKSHQFADPSLVAVARARFAACGLDPARLVLRGASGHRALLAEYADIDIVLDPHPYSGGVTTCEALWMGVPVLTYPGETFASRHSTSHLSNVGLHDWVATDRADYVARAVAKAADRPALAALRAGLRAQMRASPLCDAPRFGRNLGAALRMVWREACGVALAG